LVSGFNIGINSGVWGDGDQSDFLGQ
jgi:hypothetical protein